MEHNELKSGTSLIGWSTSAVGVGDHEQGMTRLGETLTPIANPWDIETPEWAFLRDQYNFADNGGAAAVVAQNGHAGVINRTRDKLLVLRQVQAVGSLAAALAYFITVANQAVWEAVAGIAFRQLQATDLRLPGSTAGATNSLQCEFFSFTNPGIVGKTLHQFLGPNSQDSQQMRVRVVIPPGTGCAVVCTSLNQGISVNFEGYERRRFTGELGS